MYKAIVRFKVRQTLGRFSRGELDQAMGVFGPDSVFSFYGNHALGGELHGDEEIRRFFDRAYRLFPGTTIEPVAVVVSGWPWNTVLATRFHVRATLPDGSEYRNEGMQYARLRWGRIVEDRLFEDTQTLVETLTAVAALGNDEATAPPLAALPSDTPFIGSAR